MLADEVTHVKMGSDWLRRLTEQRPRAAGTRPRVPAGRRQAVLASAASAARTTTARSGSPVASASSPGSTRRDRRDRRHRRRGAEGDDAVAAAMRRAAAPASVTGVTVTPETFTLVEFDAARAGRDRRAAARQHRAAAGTETSASRSTRRRRSAAAAVASLDPIVLTVETGALEDPKRPRQLSRRRSADVLGRLLLRVRDRLDPAFGDPRRPTTTSRCRSRWRGTPTPSAGSCASATATRQPPAPAYHFRNRHGFTDAADAAFDRLWNADGLTWADITAISDDSPAPSLSRRRCAAVTGGRGPRVPSADESVRSRSWAEIASRRSIAGGRSAGPGTLAISTIAGESKWARWAAG